MSARSKRLEENEEESATLVTLTWRTTVFLTSAWSKTSTIVDTARLTRFSQCLLMADLDGLVIIKLT